MRSLLRSLWRSLRAGAQYLVLERRGHRPQVLPFDLAIAAEAQAQAVRVELRSIADDAKARGASLAGVAGAAIGAAEHLGRRVAEIVADGTMSRRVQAETLTAEAARCELVAVACRQLLGLPPQPTTLPPLVHRTASAIETARRVARVPRKAVA